MSFWDEVFSRPKKPEHKIVDVNLNEHNAVWLLNEELKRMHKLMLHPKMYTDNNVKLFWTKVEDMQKKMYELLDKTPDINTQKQIAEIQQHLLGEVILGKEEK